MAPHRPSSAMTTRFTHLDVGCAPGGLRPFTLISLGLTFSSWISRTSGSRNVGSTCGAGAPAEIGGTTWTSGAAGGAAGSCASGGAFSACACSSEFDRKDVVRIGVFQRWRGLHWRSLAQSNVTRIGRRACFAAWKTLCPESLVQAAHGQRGLTKARRSREEVGATGSRYWNRRAREREENKGFSGLVQNAPVHGQPAS